MAIWLPELRTCNDCEKEIQHLAFDTCDECDQLVCEYCQPNHELLCWTDGITQFESEKEKEECD